MPARLKTVIRLVIAALLPAVAVASVPLACTGGATVATFSISVRPFAQGSPLPLKSVVQIPGGARLIWTPSHLTSQIAHSAEVAVALVPADGNDLITLEPRKAATRFEWQLLDRPQVIALIFGPQGLSEDKIKSLVIHNRELLKQLADYAEQSSQVESLVQELANAEQSGSSADAILAGISSKYGVDPQKLDAKGNSDQQAGLLLKTLLPISTTYDPLASRNTEVQQSGGLAASVAGLFFGNGVALAAGGATLFQNLKTVLFPATEFRSAFTQASDNDSLALCSKDPPPKAKTRTAYLWAYRVPELKKPTVSLANSPHLPLGSNSTVSLKSGDASSKELARAREWRLKPVTGGVSIPIQVQLKNAGSLEIDLSHAKIPAGDYQLAAMWDWDPLSVAGTLHLHRYGDFSHVSLARGARDKLAQGGGDVEVALSGADFEFLEKAALESSARHSKPAEVEFTLPAGKRAGPQNSVMVNIDNAKPGSYQLLLTQSDGIVHQVPVIVPPPNPKLSNLPIRLNARELREPIRLEGTGTERIESVSSDAGEITGEPGLHGWSGKIKLSSAVIEGQRYPLLLKVKGLDNPVSVPDAIEIVGPRPKILAVRSSVSGVSGMEIGAGELPSGVVAGLVLSVEHVHQNGLSLEMGCKNGELRRALRLSPGESSGGASLTLAGPQALYLSVDPGVVGYGGCDLEATLILDPEGRSNPLVLGRVMRIPRLEKFTLTTEKIGDSNYVGVLEGRDLDVIEKSGWDAEHGLPIESIPAPIPGDASRQTLRIVLPWPAPAPHAPLYVWLRGETAGRKTTVMY